jgi:uncharacterized protein (DUF3820 family)
MNIPYQDIKLKFGIYSKTPIKDVPDHYLKWLISKNILRGKLLFHCQIRFNLPKTKFQVTVEDSINTDGKYIVEAYNGKDAIIQCQKQYKIQNTQSFHGTSYDVIPLN